MSMYGITFLLKFQIFLQYYDISSKYKIKITII